MKTVLTIIVSLITSNVVIAQTSFQGRIQTSISDYEFTSSDFVGDAAFDVTTDFSNRSQSQTVSDSLLMLGIGGTFITESGYFADLYYQTSLSGSQAPLSVIDGGRATEIQEINIDRDDFALSLGKSVGSFSLSAGFKSGQTEFSQDLMFRQTVRGVEAIRPVDLDSEVKLDGPFIGLGYGTAIGVGSLSFNIAIADLQGDWNIAVNNDEIGDTFVSNLSGDATGVSIGVAWKAPINDRLSYAIGADYYNYDFDVTGVSQRADLSSDDPGDEFNGGVSSLTGRIEEQVLALKLSLIYNF